MQLALKMGFIVDHLRTLTVQNAVAITGAEPKLH